MTKLEYKQIKQEVWRDYVRRLIWGANMAYLGGRKYKV